MADNLYAGSSVQHFADPGAPELFGTHADAAGFLDYVAKFHPLNFRLQDGDVAQWRFDPAFDDAQGWRGVDSVRAYYHAGHGGIGASGVVEILMGSIWATRSSAFSSMMRIGDQKLRYLFLSTCESLCPEFGDTPYRTWEKANAGCRMLFGFGSTSFDWTDYGKVFFSRWNTGISFSQAWQEASLKLTYVQIVCSTACGATAEEAQDRLWNERFFSAERVRDDWYWWRWGGVSSDLDDVLDLDVHVPGVPMHFKSARSKDHHAERLARHFGVRLARAEEANPAIATHTPSFTPRAVLSADGDVSVYVAPVDPAAKRASAAEIRSAAERVAREIDPDGRLDLVLDRFTSTFHAGASRRGDLAKADVADYTAHFRQRFDGVPAVTGGNGHVSITLDRAGRLCNIVDRSVEVTEAARNASPPEPEATTHRPSVRELLDDAMRRRFDPCGRYELTFDPKRDEVGYRFENGEGVLVARREVTIQSGRIRKSHVVELPISALASLATAR